MVQKSRKKISKDVEKSGQNIRKSATKTKASKSEHAKFVDQSSKWFRSEHLVVHPLSVSDLDLADYAYSAAVELANKYPSVVFTSGRRTVSQQASAMATNIVKNRKYIEQTYAASAERDQLQNWVDQNPQAVTQTDIAAGLEGIMYQWSDAQKVKLSRHFAGLAFDVQPVAGDDLKGAIKKLPHLVKFLDKEGGLVIWHAEFELV
jgi:hypothetical protein